MVSTVTEWQGAFGDNIKVSHTGSNPVCRAI